MVKERRSLISERLDVSKSIALDGNTSSDSNVGPTKDDSRTCICAAEKSCIERPFTLSTVRRYETLLPLGNALGIGEDERVDGPEPLRCLDDNATLTTFMSMRQDPIASAVYLQKIGAVHVEDIRRDNGAKDTSAFPIKEYSGGGLS